MVDGVPIRVFKNHHDPAINFPDAQPMETYSSFWNADDWATQGGRVKTNWKLAPFTASLQTYNVDACLCVLNDPECAKRCSSSGNWWTQESYTTLSQTQIDEMNAIRYNNMFYNYCTDYTKAELPKECSMESY